MATKKQPKRKAAARSTLAGGSTSSNRMRTILRGLLESAKSEASDILTDPTWNMDYLFGFKLTVSDLRAIDRYLNGTSKRKSNTGSQTQSRISTP